MNPKWRKVEDDLQFLAQHLIDAIVVVEVQRKPNGSWVRYTDVATNDGLVGLTSGSSIYISGWKTWNDWDEGLECRIRYYLPMNELPLPEVTKE